MKRIVLFLSSVLLVGCIVHKMVDLVAAGGKRELRSRPDGVRRSSASGAPPILFIAFDGEGRDQLYEMLRAGELPHLAELLGGQDLSHAYLADDVLSIFPSITMAAWSSALTGENAADTGVTGNEYFIRERRELACPSPISFTDMSPTIEIYSDGYLDELVTHQNVYERIHAADPDALIWVSLAQLARGADDLLLTKRAALLDAAAAYASDKTDGKPSRDVYAVLDKAVASEVASQLGHDGPAPDVLTVYFPGIDTYAHVAPEGPDRARRAYLHDVVDPALGTITSALRAKGALAGRWVVLTSDHGHTEVKHDGEHAIATDAPRDVLRAAGFRVRAFQRHVPDDDPFSAVVTYGGPTAYVYLADRSKCPGAHDACPWMAPPRYREDVLAAAEAFRRADALGYAAPALRGTLDLILVRQPRPWADVDLPFEVYVGDGRTEPVEQYLAEHPHPTYVDFPARLRALAVGIHGERAGDLLLLSHDGDRDDPAARYYFALQYHSFHGSPSKRDSEIPLVVANPRVPASHIKPWVDDVLGPHPTITRVTDLIMALRSHPPR
jgi:hypothetical protein